MLDTINKTITECRDSGAIDVQSFFERQGGTVLSIENTEGGFISRCQRVKVNFTDTTLDFHLKWMPRDTKAKKSIVEPIACNLLLNNGINTPEVIAFIPASILTDGVNDDACVISKYYEPIDQIPIQLDSIKDTLSIEDKLKLTHSLAETLSKINSILPSEDQPSREIRSFGIHDCIEQIEQANDLGFLSKAEMEQVLGSFNLIKDMPLALTHQDAYTENLLVDSSNPSTISAIIDLEHAEFTGFGKEIFALSLFYFPRMGGDTTEKFFWEQYCQMQEIGINKVTAQAQSFGIARAAEVFIEGIQLGVPILVEFANNYKLKYLK